MKSLPKIGTEVIGYKKVRDAYGSTLGKYGPTISDRFGTTYYGGGGVIVQLLIPAEARRMRPVLSAGKCRAECALVVGMFTRDNEIITEGTFESIYTSDFKYELGAVVAPADSPYDDDPREDCSSGIHFFLTLEEAEAYL